MLLVVQFTSTNSKFQWPFGVGAVDGGVQFAFFVARHVKEPLPSLQNPLLHSYVVHAGAAGNEVLPLVQFTVTGVTFQCAPGGRPADGMLQSAVVFCAHPLPRLHQPDAHVEHVAPPKPPTQVHVNPPVGVTSHAPPFWHGLDGVVH